jgi:dimethylamine/trimethylamine dehydrogenase
MQLSKRGYNVTLAEAGSELGGRVASESSLLGLGAWKRVADHRVYDLQQRANVQMFTESALDADAVGELDIPNVFIATGSKWRRDGIGRSNRKPIGIHEDMQVLTPDDIMAGIMPMSGPVLIYDDDQVYLGGVLAEHLRELSHDVIFVTPASIVSPWTENTLEQPRIQKSLIKRGVILKTGQELTRIKGDSCVVSDVYSKQEQTLNCGSVVLVTERIRQSALYDVLMAKKEAGEVNLSTLELLGDAASPGLIADAVYAGHMAARNFEKDPIEADKEFFRREMVSLDGDGIRS